MKKILLWRYPSWASDSRSLFMKALHTVRADDEISYGAMVAPRMKQCMGGCAAYDFEPNERLCT